MLLLLVEHNWALLTGERSEDLLRSKRSYCSMFLRRIVRGGSVGGTTAGRGIGA